METFYQGHGILTVLIVLPLLGALAAYLSGERRARHVALWVGIAEFVISLPLFTYFDRTAQCNGMPMQNCVDVAWFGEWGIHYRLGMDGISLFMVLLTTLLNASAVLSLPWPTMWMCPPSR